MFCPKCGTQNPEDGKFCRKCGTDLAGVSNALTGKAIKSSSSRNSKRKEASWDHAMRKLFSGIAFFAVAIALSLSQTGRGWWFWILIPAFGGIGAGIAQIIQLKQERLSATSVQLNDSTSVFTSTEKTSLPPKQTEFVSNIPDANYETGDLVPPSVIENTTRQLEIDPEGETMTLPKDKL